MVPGSDENRLDEISDLLEKEEAQLNIHALRCKAIHTRIAALREEQRRLCSHTSTKKDSQYYSGSYYDKASTRYTLTCTSCGEVLKWWNEMHSYYG